MVVASELDKLAVEEAGVSAVLAIPQPLPSWQADSPRYHDPKRRLFCIDLRMKQLRQQLERGSASERPETAAAAREGPPTSGARLLLPQARSVVLAWERSADGRCGEWRVGGGAAER